MIQIIRPRKGIHSKNQFFEVYIFRVRCEGLPPLDLELDLDVDLDLDLDLDLELDLDLDLDL